MSFGRFDLTELPRSSQWFEEVRSNRTKLTPTFPVFPSSTHCDEGGSWSEGQFQVSSGRFNCTEPSLTTVIEPPQTTVRKGEAGRKGSLESVRGGSTAPNLLK